ncbi:Aldehyde dehydrogenase 8 member A1 [Kappamyces sp. JEL0680]|nr:Aldehyde dehydrogenase 8 member A1 [Kappamyces sp. JEL0680]
MTPFKVLNFIDGKFKQPTSTQFIESFNPSNLSVNALIADGNEADVNDAVAAARAAFLSWSETGKVYRSNLLLQIARLIEERLEEFALAESQDQGKPLSLARTVDIPRAVHNFRFFATAILHETHVFSELDGAHSYVIQDPVGVAALISPWNLPLYLLTWKIAPCLAYGCTAVCKPSEFTSVTASLLCKVFQDAGLPNGVCNMVFGTGPSAGNALIHHPDVPLLSFTGGTATGKLVYQAAALQNKKVSLELGGKNANIIFDDCNLEEALTTSVRSSFSNQGEQGIYQQFVDRFVKLVDALVVGDPLDPKTNIGAIVSKPHFDKIVSYIDIAKKEGAQILCGGVVEGKGLFIKPVVITNVHPTDSRCQKEEIFGPVVTITPFGTEDEVVQFANATQYGLSASVWTESGRRANRVSRKLRVGTVWVNTWMTRDLNVPFGGQKNSGLGREGKDDSLHFFCEAKTVCLKH